MKNFLTLIALVISLNAFANGALSERDWNIIRETMNEADRTISISQSNSDGVAAVFGGVHKSREQKLAERVAGMREALQSLGVKDADKVTDDEILSIRAAASGNKIATPIAHKVNAAAAKVKKGKNFAKGSSAVVIAFTALGTANARSFLADPVPAVGLTEKTAGRSTGSFGSFGKSDKSTAAAAK